MALIVPSILPTIHYPLPLSTNYYPLPTHPNSTRLRGRFQMTAGRWPRWLRQAVHHQEAADFEFCSSQFEQAEGVFRLELQDSSFQLYDLDPGGSSLLVHLALDLECFPRLGQVD